MAERFVRVDLSDVARDFRAIAVEPGVPLLDRSHTNAKILFKWLGGMVAEPEWEGESVSFYVRDDHGGRLEDVHTQPVSDDDLKGPLKDDVEVIRQRISKAKAETSTERAVHKILAEQFNNVLENDNRTDRPNYFFKYRDATGRWRLVWCWGYLRVDQEPGPTNICAASNCNLLFVRRKGQSPKCPSCAAALAPKPTKKKAGRRRVLLTLLLIMAVAALVYWLFNRNRLVAQPHDWRGRVGSRVNFVVKTPGIFGFFQNDVSREAVAVVDDPRVLQVTDAGTLAVARCAGSTQVGFFLGSKTARVPVTVLPPENPIEISIEPAEVALGVHTTARLKLIGQYEDGTKADLTEAAEWYPKNDQTVYALGGFLQGVGVGNSTIAARYRAAPDAEYMEATAKVRVSAVRFQELEVTIAPDPVPVGRGSRLAVSAVTADGKKFSVLDSSQLDLELEPGYLASVKGPCVWGEHPGRGRLDASFGDLSAGADFDVRRAVAVNSLVVAPNQLTLSVGEVAELSVAAPSNDPVRLSSAAPAVVAVMGTNQLVGRGVGEANVEVRQSDQVRQVAVSVARVEPRALSVEPGLVGVPIDHDVPVAVRAHTDNGRTFRLAPEMLSCDKSPSPTTAEFSRARMTLRGMKSTAENAPQSVVFRFMNLKTTAPVHVVQAPCRLELTPDGTVELPLGQAIEPEPWANYPAGHTIQLFGDRLDWHSELPKDASPGLELRGSKIVALQAGGGPMTVWGTYLGQDSNRVVFKSVEAGPVDLRLDVDRTLRLSGEPGRVILMGSGPKGDIELVSELAQFASSDAALLNIEEKTGAFRSGVPGSVEVTAKHAASEKSASVKLRVVDPAAAHLVFEPASARVAVDEKAILRLFLDAKDADGSHRDRMVGPGVQYSMGQPDAIRWHAPELVGLKPAKPFDLAASYQPYLTQSTAAKVEVLSTEKPTAIRVAPTEAELSAGQTLALAVEEQLPGSDNWREVRSDAITWNVPSSILWQPATEGLRPTVTVPHGTSGSLKLTAQYRDQAAAVTIKTSDPALDPTDTSVRLVLQREPEGRYLPVGKQQRYSILLRKGNQQIPAGDIRWPRVFENDYVRWEAPVLTAKRAGYQQWLNGQVGGRTVRFYTHTVDPFQPSVQPVREEQPFELVIASDQGSSVAFPVGAEFDDFRIEAQYPDGLNRIVTKKATMRMTDGTSGPVAFSDGRIIGVQPGQTVVQAEFEGVPTQTGLQVHVTEQVDVDEIVVSAPAEMLVGETLGLEATGVKDGKSVGKITGLGGLRFRSDNPQKANVIGSSVTGIGLGQAGITAEFGGKTSDPVSVSVVDSIADRLEVREDHIWMRVGESRWIGSDFAVRRGDTDLSRQVQVCSSLPQVVDYDPETHSLRANQIGRSVVTFAWSDKTTNVTVEVVPGGFVDGQIVVEPALSTLAPGQAAVLRVLLVSEDGHRIDRTNAAVFSSSDNNVVMLGNMACAVATGTAQVTATLPEAEQPGEAAVNVNDQEILELIVDPSQLSMSVGDARHIEILGRASSGTHPVFPQQALQVTAGGPNPEAIRIEGGRAVDALATGNAEVNVNFAEKLIQRVPVTVTDDPYSDLVIDPPAATVHPGQSLVYQVTAMRGGLRRVLGAADGLQLLVTQPEVARPSQSSTAVVGAAPGRTTVVAQVGPNRAEAVLDVVPGDGPTGVAIGGVVYDGGDVVYGTGGDVIYRSGVAHGYGRVGYDDWWGAGGYMDGGTTVFLPPAAAAAHLRFVPEVVRVGSNSPGADVQVYEVLADGTLGRDVTRDPSLEFNVVENVARIDKGTSGPARVVPVSPGSTRIGARLGDPPLFAEPELLVQVGDYAIDTARLVALPSPVDLWAGETARLDNVMVVAGAGQAPFEVDYSLAPQPGQNIVTVDADKNIRALTTGRASVVVTAVGPGTFYDGLSTTVPLSVGQPGALWLEPREASLKVGEMSPPFAVMAEDSDGLVRQLPAMLESVDPNVLVADSQFPSRFLARGLGRTQVRAVYRNREMYADVNVTGDRFIDVQSSLVERQGDFSVTIEILAANSEGPLEYRVYPAGQSPGEVWADAQSAGDYQRVVLQSQAMAYGPRGTRYGLVLEARSKADSSVQRYPFTFRLAPKIVTETP